MQGTTSLVYVLISVIGGGTIVPLAYKVVERWRSRKSEGLKDRRTQSQIESISSHAAVEAVEATRGALTVLREQLRDGHQEIAELRSQHDADMLEIARLRNRISELTRPPTI